MNALLPENAMPANTGFSIVVPVYNSQATLPELHRRLTTTMEALGEPFELVFVEDGGRDGSWKVLETLAELDPRLKAVQLMRNSGQGNATLAGIEQSTGEIIVTLDDDLQHPPEEIPSMIGALRADHECDVVIGAPEIKRHNLVRRTGSALVNRVNTWFLHKDPELRFTGFRAMRRNVAEALLGQRVPYPALGPMLISITPRIVNLVVRHDARQHGRSGYDLRRIIKQTLANFIGYSILPLHMLAAIGAFGVLFSILFSVYFAVRYFAHGIGVPGWTTLLLTLLGLSGFNFFAFGVLGEYILRISRNTERLNHRIVRRIASSAAPGVSGK
ncbi:glycosyltransferase family 2 protein [Luteimonas sp. SJ-92]|uniref:Glycosyltransferase family 2 protein n=1 Tax=Luteimonas salinisoli TaxID=2752307 RepID=A0A853J880_9GAMM|nr:glycosyltransferase family 2 protein [Luteimonas salinisoli]NZA25313.1 glycosyltransferase family 2 protein [Luteimonas salinisoli]